MKDIIKQLKEALKDCCDLLDEIEVNKGVNGRAALELREGNALPPMELLRKMEAFIPSGEGSVSTVTRTDGSWAVEIEYQALVIARPHARNRRLTLDEPVIVAANPAWLPEVREWFAKIQEVWQQQ